MFPRISFGRSLLSGPRRVPRLAAPLRLALRLPVRRLQKLGTGLEGRGIRHGARLCPAARADHRGEPALPAGPSRRHAPLRHALRTSARPRGVVLVAEQRGGTGPDRGGRRPGQLPRDDQRPCRLQRLCHQRRALRHGQGERHVREHRAEVPPLAAQPAQIQRSEGQEGPAGAGRGGLHRTQAETLGRSAGRATPSITSHVRARRPTPSGSPTPSARGRSKNSTVSGPARSWSRGARYASSKKRHTDLWKQPR